MSIATAITAAQGKVANAYTAVSNKGGTLPATQNLTNLPTAISSIPSGSTVPTTNYGVVKSIDATGGVSGFPDIIVPLNISSVSYESAGYQGMFSIEMGPNYVGPHYERIATSDINNEALHLGAHASGSTTYTGGALSEIYIAAKSIIDSNNRYILENAAKGNDKLVKADFGGVETLSGPSRSFQGIFADCVNLEDLKFTNLTDLSGVRNCALMGFIDGCTKLKTLTFPKLNNIGNALRGTAAQGGAFRNSSLESLSFPAFTSTTVTDTNQFLNMLKGTTGCTVHFPSNLQSIMSEWASVQNGFGGTNTTILWDLPATS